MSSANASVAKFDEIAAGERFKGWQVVGDIVIGEKIPFFGQVISYQLETGNGVEDYFSLLRNFGWAVAFGVTEDDQVITLVQWKPGVNQASWELPPGGIGKIPTGMSQEVIDRTTAEYFLKETGYGDGTWKLLGTGIVETGKYRGPGPNDHGLPAYMYLATGLKPIGNARNPNPNEIMETLMVPLADFDAVLDSGRFNEISAMTCALLALRELRRSW